MSDSRSLVGLNSEKTLSEWKPFYNCPLPLFMTNFLLSSDAEKIRQNDPMYRGRILERNWDKKSNPPCYSHSHLPTDFIPPPPMIINGLKLVCNLYIVYGNLKSENSRDCTLMNSASG